MEIAVGVVDQVMKQFQYLQYDRKKHVHCELKQKRPYPLVFSQSKTCSFLKPNN